MQQTWLCQKVVSIDNDRLLTELVGHEIEQLIQFLKSDLVFVEVIPAYEHG